MIKGKKLITFILSLTLLTSSAGLSGKVFASTIDKNEIKQFNIINNGDLASNKIIKTINDLLSIKYEIMKTGNFHSSNNLVKDSKLLELTEKTNQLYNEWYKKNNIKIDSYSSKTNIVNMVKTDENTYMIDVAYDVEFKLAGMDTNSKSLGEKYRFEVISQNDEWYITKMLDLNGDKSIDESSDNISSLANGFNKNNFDKVIIEKLSDVNNRLNNFDSYYENYKKIEPKKAEVTNSSLLINSQVATASAYNYYSAVDYAHLYALSKGNSTYTYFDGDDCTNFVSQCVHAGGIPTNFTWNLYTNAWVGVIPFYNYMTSAGYAYSNTWTNNARTGDVVQFYNPASATWSHSVILTGTDPYGNWLFCGHSRERYDYLLSQAYVENGYTNERTIAFWH